MTVLNNCEPILSPIDHKQQQFDLGKDGLQGRPTPSDNFSWWSFGENPLWLNFSNPTIINLHNETWDQDYVVIPEEYPENSWVYLVITAPSSAQVGRDKRSFFPVAHPVGLTRIS